ncbi:MAG: hypothetical protein J3K34DRAFT_517169 [Monoraphidium minutum]|nr:MAG: hypothetical protein J3K34DRAFT_517169 [Monoraphidium minutum]
MSYDWTSEAGWARGDSAQLGAGDDAEYEDPTEPSPAPPDRAEPDPPRGPRGGSAADPAPPPFTGDLRDAPSFPASGGGIFGDNEGSAGDGETGLGPGRASSADRDSASRRGAFGGDDAAGGGDGGGAAWRLLAAQRAGEWCSLNPMTDPFPAYCSPGLICYTTPYLAPDVAPAPAAADPGQARVGTCAPPAEGALMPARQPALWPVPAVYFPLSEGSIQEYPMSFSPGSTHRTSSAPDGRFGSALSCDASRQSFVALRPGLDYAGNGSFAINVWIKPSASRGATLSSTSGGAGGAGGAAPAAGGLAYVLSHAPAGAAGGAPAANSVALMLPRPGHKRFGVARGVLRDGDDGSAAPGGAGDDGAWLDSDGGVGVVAVERASGDPGALPGGPGGAVPGALNLYDGEWHMVTLSTLPPGPGGEPRRGFRLFVDGVLRAEMSGGGGGGDGSSSDEEGGGGSGGGGASSYEQGGGGDRELGRAGGRRLAQRPSGSAAGGADPPPRAPRPRPPPVTGGDPLDLAGGHLVLCGRSDRDPRRFYSGLLSNLALFDEALTQDQVAALYAEYVRQSVIYPAGGKGLASLRRTVSGAACLLPISYSGAITYDCISLMGRPPSCPTAQRPGAWEECAPAGADGGGGGRGSSAAGAGARGRSAGEGRAEGYPRGLAWAAAEGVAVVAAPPPPPGAPGTPAAARGGAGADEPPLPRFTLSGQRCASACVTVRGRELCAAGGGGAGPAALSGGGRRAPGGLQQCAPSVGVPPVLTQCGAAAAAVFAPNAAGTGAAAGGTWGGFGGGGGSGALAAAGAAAQAYSRCVVMNGVELCLLTPRRDPSSGAPPGATAAAAPPLWVRCPVAGGRWPASSGPAARAPGGGASFCGFPFSAGGGGLARSDCAEPPGGGGAACALTLPIDDGDGDPTTTSLRLVPVGAPPLLCADPLDASARGAGGAGAAAAAALALGGEGFWPSNPMAYASGAARPPGGRARRYALSRDACLPLVASPSNGAAMGVAAGAGGAGGTGLGGGGLPEDMRDGGRGGECVLDPETADFECAVKVGAPPQKCAPLSRRTLSGAQCSFPFVYDGASRDDCAWMMGLEACRTEAGAWEACGSDYLTTWQVAPPGGGAAKRYTVDAQPCVQPFTFRDQPVWGCLPVNTTTTVTISAFPAGAAGAGLGLGGGGPSPLLSATATAAGLNPQTLYGLPGAAARPAGASASASAAGNGAGSGGGGGGGGAAVCLTGSGEFGFCAPLLQPRSGGGRGAVGPGGAPVRLTTGGVPCNLPFAFGGTLFYDCVRPPFNPSRNASAGRGAGGYCRVPDGSWAECAAAGGGAGGAAGRGRANGTSPASRSAADVAAALLAGGLFGAMSDVDFAAAVNAAAANLSASPAAAGGGGRVGPPRAVTLGLGIALGLGGGLLLAAIALGAAVKRGVVYRVRSRRFQEASLDPQPSGECGTIPEGAGGGRASRAARAVKGAFLGWGSRKGLMASDGVARAAAGKGAGAGGGLGGRLGALGRGNLNGGGGGAASGGSPFADAAGGGAGGIELRRGSSALSSAASAPAPRAAPGDAAAADAAPWPVLAPPLAARAEADAPAGSPRAPALAPPPPPAPAAAAGRREQRSKLLPPGAPRSDEMA